MSDEKKESENYVELAASQRKVVDELTAKVGEPPSENETKQLEIEREKLLFYQTAANGDPRSRAKNVIERSRSAVLGRAIIQPLP
jgi:hypothetical protein